MEKIKIGISIGDINGIGVEVILKTFQDSRMMELCTPVIYGDTEVISSHKKMLDITDLEFNKIQKAEDSKPSKANLVDCIELHIRFRIGYVNGE